MKHHIYSADLPWFRGNLHCHSTNSDGALPPQKVASHYANLDYHFLALTDHLMVTDPEPLQRDELLLIPGTELHGDEQAPGRTYHLVVIGQHATDVAAVHQTSDHAQTVIDRAHQVGCVVFIAHPYRLGMTTEEVTGLKHADGLEVYNNISRLGGKADSSVYWDTALDAGLHLWGFANDDAHFRRVDYGGGWITVQAPALDVANIRDALRNGHFYASTGPQFHELTVDQRTVHVRCSPAHAVRFLSNRMLTHGIEADDVALAEATWTVPAHGHYVRVVVEDQHGRCAWSQPIWLD
jgi:hypothetical protein